MVGAQQARAQAPSKATKAPQLCGLRSAIKRTVFRQSREHKVQERELCCIDQEPHWYSESATREPALTASVLRSDCRLQHLLPLKKSDRDHALNASASERQQLYLLRRADEKVRKLARKNQKLSMMHAKGARRKTQRVGVGKGGSCSLWGIDTYDVDAAIKHAHASMSGEPWDSDEMVEDVSRLATKSYTNNEPVMPKELKDLLLVLAKTECPFERFRAQFLKRHYSALSDALGRCAEGRVLTPTPLSPELQQRFLSACHQNVNDTALGFHGTADSSYKSIFSRGLLVPGEDNEIRVAHGSAYGKGVYIAKPSNPWLSQGFATRYGANKMLVCGVVDDSKNLDQVEKVGTLSMTRKSNDVYHVGDAMVVFDSARVAPLFVAQWKRTRAEDLQPTKQRVNYQASSCQGGHWVRGQWAWEVMKHRRSAWLRKKFPMAVNESRHRRRVISTETKHRISVRYRNPAAYDINWRCFFNSHSI